VTTGGRDQPPEDQDEEGEPRRRGDTAMNLLDELRSLDPRDPGRGPAGARRRGRVVRFLALRWWCLIPGLERAAPGAAAASGQEQQLRQEFRRKHAKAGQPRGLQQQLKDIERSFARCCAAPRQDRGAELLVTSRRRLAAGSRRSCSASRAEEDFYAELPSRSAERQLPPVREL